jgi:hypothetical protein
VPRFQFYRAGSRVDAAVGASPIGVDDISKTGYAALLQNTLCLYLIDPPPRAYKYLLAILPLNRNKKAPLQGPV